MRRGCELALAIGLIGVVSGAVSAQTGGTTPAAEAAREIPRLVPFSGQLRAAADAQPRTALLTFSLYAEQRGGTPLWIEQQLVTLDGDGRYSAVLGAASAEGLPAPAFATAAAQWLGVRVDNDPEEPRFMLLSVPYALKAGDADTLAGKPPTDFVLNGESLKQAIAESVKPSALKDAAAPSAPLVTPNALVKYATSGGALTESSVVDVGGNVGIQVAAPATELDVAGGGSTTTITLRNGGKAADVVKLVGSDGSVRIGSATNANLINLIGPNVGVGTTGPSAVLHVVGSQPSAVSSGDGTSASGVLQITGGKGGNLTSSSTANFGGRGGSVVIQGGAGGDATGGHGGEGGSITLQPGLSGSGPNNPPSPPGAVILAPFGGNVGVGSSLPISKFQVAGNSNFGGTVGIGTAFPVGMLNVVGSAGQAQGIQIDNRELKFRGDGVAHFSIFANRISGALTIEDTSDSFVMNTPGTVALAILGSGGNANIGIGGVTAPTSRLQVNGQGRFSTVNIDSYVSGQTLPLCTTGSGGNQNLIGLCSSSLRYKTNVQSFRAGLDIVRRLRPISFDWKEAGTHDVGLAAEEVGSVEPLLTFRNDAGEIEGVKYNQLSAVFINAFKEQQAQIEEQRAALAAQQQQLAALKKLICRPHSRAIACR